MKCIPLWQPYASLVAMGAKRIETRHWRPHGWMADLMVTQRVAIHACKTKQALHLCHTDPFDRYVPNAGVLPLGAIVATAEVVRFDDITEQSAAELADTNPYEHAFGDYTPGRYAWILTNVTALAKPIPFTGQQGIFEIPHTMIPGGGS